MSPRAAGLAMLAALLVSGCGEPAAEMREVRISGTARLPDGSTPAGTLHVHAYRAWTGQGELRHPLGPLGEFTGEAGAFSGTAQYAVGEGEGGLVVYAWLDADGDGVLCTPLNTAEPAGLVLLGEMPVEEASVAIVLAETCKAADWFYPPAAAAAGNLPPP